GPGVADQLGAGRDAAQHAGQRAAGLRERLASEPVRSDGEEVVLPAGGADEPGGLVLILGNEAAVLADPHVAPHLLAAIVARGAVGIEADQPREPPGAAVHLVDDLLVVDPLEQLPRDADASGRPLPPELVQEAVSDELQALFDELVVNLALPLDLFGSLELRRKTGLELAEADVVEAGSV